MSGSAPVPKPRASLKSHEDEDSSAAQLGSPPGFKPPPPRPKNKPVAVAPSHEETVPSTKDEFVHPSQVELEMDPPKDKTPTKSGASRVAPPVPKSEQTQRTITDSPKRPAPGPPRQTGGDPSGTESKVTPSASPSLPSGPKHSRSVSTGHKLPHSGPTDTEHKSHSRQMSEHLVDDVSPKITPKRVAPPPPTSGGKGDKKPPRPDEHVRPTTRSESCQQFTNIPSSVPSKQKELKPKEKRAPAVPAPKQPPQSAKPPPKQSSFEGAGTKGTNSPPQRASPKAVRKMSNAENRTLPNDDEGDGGAPTSAIDRIKRSGVALPFAVLPELKKKEQQQQQQQQEDSAVPSRNHPSEPTISYMESPMLATDDASRKVKFSRQLKTWLTYASEEYDRANNVNVVQAAVLFELEKLIEKMHIYSVQLSKCNNALGMHIRSQNLNSTPEVGGQILGIFISNVSTNSPADLSGSIMVGDLLLEVDGKPMIGSSRSEAMQILNDTGESVQLMLGRPSSPILVDKTVSPVSKDAPVEIDQGLQPSSPLPLKSPTSPTTKDPVIEKIRPRSRSTTPEKPKPPPVVQAKPKVAPPKPPRVKPRTHVGGAHLSGEQREGQTPTPPTTRDDTPSSEQKVEKAPVNQEQAPKDTQTSSETEVTNFKVEHHQPQQQQPVSDTKVPPEVMADLTSLKEENAKLLKAKEGIEAEMKAYQLKVTEMHAQKEAEWKSTILRLQNELQEKCDLLLSTEQVKKQEMEQLEHRIEESDMAAAENMELLNSKVKETRGKYMELLGELKEMEKKNKELTTELETSHKNLQLSEEELKNKETEYQSKIAALEEKATTAVEGKESEEPVKVVDESEIEKLKEELSTVRAEKDKELSELQSELDDIKEKQGEKDKQIVELNEELAMNKKTLKDNKTLLVALKEDLKSAQSCMDQMQGRNRGLTEQLKEEKDERKKKEERLIELTVENKKHEDEITSFKSELEDLRKQVEEQKEQLKKKDEQISQYQTRTQEMSADKETTPEPTNKSTTDAVTEYVNVEGESKGDDEQYVSVDTTSGDVMEKESSKENNEPIDLGPEYVNMPVDDDNEESKEDKKQVENEESTQEVDGAPELDLVVKTETITSTSQLTRAKVSTTLKRKPPSRGLLRRTAEESGSQENLFEIADADENDYVNMPVNKAVVPQPKPKPVEPQPHQKEDEKPTDSVATSNDDKKDELPPEEKSPVASNEDKAPVENKGAPPVAEKPHTKSPVAQVRRPKVGGVPLLPVTQQMEEILNRQRLATESALRKESNEGVLPRSMSSAKAPPPAVKKKPVRAPLKSSLPEEDEKKSNELSGALSRSCENLATTGDDKGTVAEQNNNNGKVNKRISMSMSVEDIKELKDPVKDIRELKDPIKPPVAKARKMLPGAVKLIAPKPREGQVELVEDEADSSNVAITNQDKEDTSLDHSNPQTPEKLPNSPENRDDESPGDNSADADKLSEATGGSGNADVLLLPDWTIEEVCIWLQRCGLGEFSTGIKLGDVTGKVLVDLDSNKMKALGIFNNNDRKLLQKEIKSVKLEHERLKKAEKKKADAEKKLAKKEEKKKKK